MLQLLDKFTLLLFKLVFYILFALFLFSSFKFIIRLIDNPATIKQLIYIFKTFPSLSSLHLSNLLII